MDGSSPMPAADILASRVRFVETYRDNGVWKSRRSDSPIPFATGGSRQHQISVGAEVARWHEVEHIVRDPDLPLDDGRPRDERVDEGGQRRGADAVGSRQLAAVDR